LKSIKVRPPHSNITEPLWSVFGDEWGKFPHPTSLKQFKDVLQEEWYKIPIKTVLNFYEPIRRRTAAVLLCPTPVHVSASEHPHDIMETSLHPQKYMCGALSRNWIVGPML
jgi:hypothetical protein